MDPDFEISTAFTFTCRPIGAALVRALANQALELATSAAVVACRGGHDIRSGPRAEAPEPGQHHLHSSPAVKGPHHITRRRPTEGLDLEGPVRAGSDEPVAHRFCKAHLGAPPRICDHPQMIVGRFPRGLQFQDTPSGAGGTKRSGRQSGAYDYRRMDNRAKGLAC